MPLTRAGHGLEEVQARHESFESRGSAHRGCGRALQQSRLLEGGPVRRRSLLRLRPKLLLRARRAHLHSTG